MAMFLAGLRGVDDEIMKAAQIDGASTFQHLPAHRHPAAAAGVPVGLHRARPPRDQDLRPGGGADRRRPRRLGLAAGELHVRVHLHAQPDGIGAASAVIMLMTIAAIIVPYLYSELQGEGAMSAVSHRRRADRRRHRHQDAERASSSTALLALFALVLPDAAVRHAGDLVQDHGRDPDRQHAGAAAGADLRRPGSRPGASLRRPDLRRHQGLLLELDQDGRAGGADLDAARRAQRLRADQVALPRRTAGVRADAVRLLHPVPDRCCCRWRRSSAPRPLRHDAATHGMLRLGNPTDLVFVHVVYGLGFTTLFFRNYYEAFPTELVKAAQIDGAGFFQIFRRIMLPNSMPIIVVTVIWQFTNIWNDFLFGVVLRRPATPCR